MHHVPVNDFFSSLLVLGNSGLLKVTDFSSFYGDLFYSWTMLTTEPDSANRNRWVQFINTWYNALTGHHVRLEGNDMFVEKSVENVKVTFTNHARNRGLERDSDSFLLIEKMKHLVRRKILQQPIEQHNNRFLFDVDLDDGKVRKNLSFICRLEGNHYNNSVLSIITIIGERRVRREKYKSDVPWVKMKIGRAANK